MRASTISGKRGPDAGRVGAELIVRLIAGLIAGLIARLGVVLIAAGLVAAAPARAQTIELPPRASDALTGTQLGSVLTGVSLEEREARVLREVMAGNVPSWYRSLVEVPLGRESGSELSIWAAPDYLLVGSDEDALRMPLSPQTAQEIADLLGMALPTPRLVDRLWTAATVRLEPRPIDPGPAMTTVPVFLEHDALVEAQWRARGVRRGVLVAGHKKDVVVSRELPSMPGRVAIYGWHESDGTPIQPLYLGHTDRWVDYSHGVRLISRVVRVDGEIRDWYDVLRDSDLADVLSGEGVLRKPRYPRVWASIGAHLLEILDGLDEGSRARGRRRPSQSEEGRGCLR